MSCHCSLLQPQWRTAFSRPPEGPRTSLSTWPAPSPKASSPSTSTCLSVGWGSPPPEVVEHTFGIVDRLVANLRDFTSQLVALVPDKGEARPTAVKASSKAQAA